MRRFWKIAAVCGLVLAASIVPGPGAAANGEPVALEGTLGVVHSDDFAAGRAAFRYSLSTDQDTYELEFPEGRPDLPLAARVHVRGIRSGHVVAVGKGGLEPAAGSVAAATTGAKSVAVILFYFSDNTSQPYTPATARGIAFTNNNSAANYYAENSWNQLTITGEVFGWYAIPDTSTQCNYTAWAASADQAAIAAGVNLSAYNYRTYAFPSVSACGWSGLAYLPGTRSFLNGSGGMSLRVMSHEWGHNFGTHHSSSLSCSQNGARVPLSASSANCTVSEYGDPFSVMGAASARHHTNFSRGNIGWLTAANTQDVLTSGSYTLAPAEWDAPAAIQALRIARGTNRYLQLEFRQPYGTYYDNFSTSDPVVNGVTARIAPGYSSLTQSQLVDATPATTSFSDAAIGVGKSLYDPLLDVTITTQSVSAAAAVVQITFGPDLIAPSAPVLATTALSASSIRLNWTASTDNIGVAGYRVYRDGVTSALTTVSGTTLTYTDAALTASTTYSYHVVVFDAAGNEAVSNTSTATTPAADIEKPMAPTNLRITLRGPRATLTWNASTDNIGVTGYRVYRGGSMLAQVSTTSHTDTPNKGSNTYYVVAVDAAGNISAASNSFTITR